MSSLKFGKFCPLFLQIHSLPLSLFPSSSGTPIVLFILACLMVSHKSHRLCSLFSTYYSVCSGDLIISRDQSSSLLILFPVLILPSNTSSEFFNSVTVFFSSRIYCFNLHLSADILVLFIYCFPYFF